MVSLFRSLFLIFGLLLGLLFLYIAGPGWETFDPGYVHRGSISYRYEKTNLSRFAIAAAGIFFGGGAAFSLAMMLRAWKRRCVSDPRKRL